MNVTINKSIAKGRITAPPSKSMAHRYLICGALSDGISIIRGVDFSKDVTATLDCLKKLGADVKIDGNTVELTGIDIKNKIYENNLFCDESGSTLRFLIPLCMLFDEKIKLSGSSRLFSRSLSVYSEIAKKQNLLFYQDNTSVTVKGVLSSGKYVVRGDISSQFISGLMFALPLLSNDSTIEIVGGFESKAYLALTVKALEKFDVKIEKTSENSFYIKGNQRYKHTDLTVEGDYSNAAFFDAFNTIGGNVTVDGLLDDSAQGDKVYKKYFSELLNGAPTIDISDCPDLGPILITVAAMNNGALFIGTHRLKIKESDRGIAMRDELAKFGGIVEVKENEILVKKTLLHSPTEILKSHNDHRIVMSLSVISSLYGGTIESAEAVAKSFPDFFEKLTDVSVKTKVEENEAK